MSSELNWFNIRRWERDRLTKKHEIEMTKKNPPNTDYQVLSMIAKGLVTIKRTIKEDKEEEEEEEPKEEKNHGKR